MNVKISLGNIKELFKRMQQHSYVIFDQWAMNSQYRLMVDTEINKNASSRRRNAAILSQVL